jgi:hypothetical protein
MNMDEITSFRWGEGGEPMSLYGGAWFTECLLAAKIYLVMLVAYIILRIKKYKNRNLTAENPQSETTEASA